MIAKPNDDRCLDLAQIFLEGDEQLNTEQHAYELADYIQAAIEEWFEWKRMPGVMTSEDQAQQDRIHAHAAEIMRVVSGIPFDEASTALTVSVAAVMITWEKITQRNRADMASNFARSLQETLAREDIVEWIKAHTTYVAPGMNQ